MRFACAFCSSRRLCTYVRDLDGLTYLHELLDGPFEHLEQPPEAVPKQISSFNTNNGLGRPKKGSRHNPPLSECRATPREWLADATLLCQSISIWRASAPYSYMLLHQLYVLYCIYCIYCILYSHDMSCCSKGITTKPAIFTRALCNSSE